MAESTKLIECPRDAWQGLPDFIPTEYKAKYLNELVAAGFKHIDAISFVSPKHVKQMARDESRLLVEKLRKETAAANRGLVIYISMAFGNPYDEPWGPEIVADTLEWLKDIRVRTVSLADTVGNASPKLVGDLYRSVKDHVAGIELGVHLHSRPENAEEKILAAYEAGCRRFDGALTGLGGCPFAGDNLVGNIATEDILAALRKAGADPGVDSARLTKVLEMTNEIRAKYAHAPLLN
jgi:hydroxymethylglutaryl-CoA lyase